MKRLTLFSLLACSFVFFLQSCQEDIVLQSGASTQLNLPSSEFNYSNIDLPGHLSESGFNGLSDNTPIDNTITDAGATLGRVLFYDTKMSKNNAVSCGSCHHQAIAFSDVGAVSTGFEGLKTTRNSMPISNLRFSKNFFWDTGVTSLEQQVLEPVKNHIEMGMEDLDFLVEKLNRTDYYPALFEKAYGSTEITSEKVSKSLAQFLRAMVSYESKFDKGMETNFSNFSELEKMGMDLFNDHERTSCADCHRPNLNFGPQWRDNANIGLDLVYEDEGAGNGRFKIPSLRNVALTAPYMHDGRYNTLEEVIDHYSDNIQNHPDLDWTLRGGGGAKRMDLNPLEKRAMIAFLKTLTDESYTEDPKYSNPFN